MHGGCVQEEIMFALNPEAFVSMLLCQVHTHTRAHFAHALLTLTLLALRSCSWTRPSSCLACARLRRALATPGLFPAPDQHRLLSPNPSSRRSWADDTPQAHAHTQPRIMPTQVLTFTCCGCPLQSTHPSRLPAAATCISAIDALCFQRAHTGDQVPSSLFFANVT